jgi:hypothetical protein
LVAREDVDGRDKPGHDDEGDAFHLIASPAAGPDPSRPNGPCGMVRGVAGSRPSLGDVGTEKDREPMIDELDLVVLKRDLPTERLAVGDVGTFVLVHQQGAGYEVEFMTLSGDTVAVVTLDASDVRPVEAREIVHARAVN